MNSISNKDNDSASIIMKHPTPTMLSNDAIISTKTNRNSTGSANSGQTFESGFESGKVAKFDLTFKFNLDSFIYLERQHLSPRKFLKFWKLRIQLEHFSDNCTNSIECYYSGKSNILCIIEQRFSHTELFYLRKWLVWSSLPADGICEYNFTEQWGSES